MTYLLVFFILLSMTVSGLLIWYIRGLLRNYKFLLEKQAEIQVKVTDFADHLKQVYEMDSFYGDSTLEKLLTHTSELETSLRDTIILGGDIYNERGITNDTTNE